jgi:hypothetical protein
LRGTDVALIEIQANRSRLRGKQNETICNVTLGRRTGIIIRGSSARAAAPNASIQGTWAFGASALYEGEEQSNGTLTFDGRGGVTGIMNYAYGGTICAGMTLAGSYIVNPGKITGTASMTLESVDTANCAAMGDGDTLTINFALSNGLKNFTFNEIDPYTAGYFTVDFEQLAGVAAHF